LTMGAARDGPGPVRPELRRNFGRARSFDRPSGIGTTSAGSAPEHASPDGRSMVLSPVAVLPLLAAATGARLVALMTLAEVMADGGRLRRCRIGAGLKVSGRWQAPQPESPLQPLLP
jgi:hypothetical protein